ncbi:MAG: hypothetical protein GXO83_07940 [Chlorobi bacterium]|nr:hypothetical protein [Chlorobiota bacterium]
MERNDTILFTFFYLNVPDSYRIKGSGGHISHHADPGLLTGGNKIHFTTFEISAYFSQKKTMPEKVVLVLDCGATNIRTIAVNPQGKIRAVSSLPNETSPDPKYPDYRIWDISLLWDKFSRTTRGHG